VVAVETLTQDMVVEDQAALVVAEMVQTLVEL
jgi:hypothetical protein